MAGNWIMYDSAKVLLGSGGIAFDTDTIKVALVLSSYTPSLSHNEWGDVSADEIANGNGYTTGGTTMTTTVSASGSTTKLSASNNAAWNATGSGITARYAVMRKVGTVGGLTDPLIGYCLLSATGDVTVISGNTLTIGTPAGGFFDFSGATS